MRNIPHSKEMILAFAAGNKTQTRRERGLNMINEKPDQWKHKAIRTEPKNIQATFEFIETEEWELIKYPYGKPGDLVYLGEGIRNKNGFAVYDADGTDVLLDDTGGYMPWKWKPNYISSVYMPANAARYFAKIEKVRVERLYDITGADSIAEGIEIRENGFKDYIYGTTFIDPVLSYFSLWNKINGSESLMQNPWVWVTEYKRHTPFCKTLVAEATAKKEGVCQQ